MCLCFLSIIVFWAVTQCGLIGGYNHFRGMNCHDAEDHNHHFATLRMSRLIYLYVSILLFVPGPVGRPWTIQKSFEVVGT
jgi:hypothetical protein